MMTSSLLSYFQDTKWRHRTNTNLKKLVGKFGTEWSPKIISFRGVLCSEIRMTCLISNQYQEVFHHRPGFESEPINLRKYFIVIKCQCFSGWGHQERADPLPDRHHLCWPWPSRSAPSPPSWAARWDNPLYTNTWVHIRLQMSSHYVNFALSTINDLI